MANSSHHSEIGQGIYRYESLVLGASDNLLQVLFTFNPSEVCT